MAPQGTRLPLQQPTHLLGLRAVGAGGACLGLQERRIHREETHPSLKDRETAPSYILSGFPWGNLN